MESEPKKDYDWMLCVRSYTYNHSSYILDALNGFTMQQTNFPFVCCIVDDASTDNAPAKIYDYVSDNFDIKNDKDSYIKHLDYGTLVFARHKENVNCYFVALLLRDNHNATPVLKALKRSYIAQWENSSRYEALCEGDDYWTDPLKLQKQVDFLESHPDYSMCFHEAIEHFEEVGLDDRAFSTLEDKDYTGVDIYKNWIVPTASVVVRNSVNNSELRKKTLKQRKFVFGDILLFLCAASMGRVYGMSEIMSVYRRHEGGATHGSSINQDKRIIEHHKEIPKVFGKQYKPISKRHISNLYMSMRYKYRQKGKRISALGCLIMSMYYDLSPLFIIIKGKLKVF